MTSCVVKTFENRPLLYTSEVIVRVQPGPSPKGASSLVGVHELKLCSSGNS